MRPSSTARRYAEAAFGVAQQEGDTAGWLNELRGVSSVLADPAVAVYFKDPKVRREEQLAAIGRMFSAMRPHLLNLLRILVIKHRIHLVDGIAVEFERLEREARGIAEAEITVARPMSEEERNQVAQRLGELMNRRVEVTTRVDPEILGGIIVRLGDQLIDASVSGRLQRLGHQLAV